MNTACDIACEWDRTVAPVIDPISTDQAIDQARAPVGGELGGFLGYIKAATEAAEAHMNRGLLTQTWKLAVASFADVIWLPMAAPLQSVSSVKYYNTATPSVLTTLDSSYYVVNTTSRPGSIERAPGLSWLSVQSDRRFPIEITYVVGWTAADLVPERIKQGIRLYVAYMHYDREGLSEYGEQACQAAHACWDDVVYWKPPTYA